MTIPFGQTRIHPTDPRFAHRVAEHLERTQNGELPFRQLSLAGALDVPVRSVTTTQTITEQDTVILADATAGAITLTLPVAAGRRRCLGIKRLNAGANAVTIAAAGTDTIDGAATSVLTIQWASLTLVSDGISGWFIV